MRYFWNSLVYGSLILSAIVFLAVAIRANSKLDSVYAANQRWATGYKSLEETYQNLKGVRLEERKKLWDALMEAQRKIVLSERTFLLEDTTKEEVIALCSVPEGVDSQLCDEANFQTEKTWGVVVVTYKTPAPFTCALFAEAAGIETRRWYKWSDTEGDRCFSVALFEKPYRLGN